MRLLSRDHTGAGVPRKRSAYCGEGLRWDPVRDFTPIGQICRAPNFFIVPSTLPVKTAAEYVALAKAKPGTLNYSHPGKGSTGHLGFELFKRLAGIDVTGIGYRGYPQMVPDITSGLINSTFLSANQALAQLQTGAIRIIGAISDGRSKYFPDVPTMAEQGFAEAQVTPWFGVVVPAGYAAAGGGAHQQGPGGGAGDLRYQTEARRGGLRAEERAARGVRRYHQVRRGGMGQGGQGGRHHRRLTFLTPTQGPVVRGRHRYFRLGEANFAVQAALSSSAASESRIGAAKTVSAAPNVT